MVPFEEHHEDGRLSVDIPVIIFSSCARDYADDAAVPFTRGAAVASGVSVVASGSISGELLRVKEDVSVSSSGIVANFLKTCLSAGRRMGLLMAYQ